MAERSDGQNGKSDGKDDLQQTRWPWWGQFLLAVIALSIACVLLIWLPMEIGSKTRNDTGNTLTTFIAVLVGLTTMTISGMFLFMTFRIDRGARLEAQRVAEKEIKENRGVKYLIEKTREQKNRAVHCMDSAKNEAMDKIAEIRDETKEKIERDMENIKNEAVNRTNEQVDRLIAEARGKIDKADIEKLLDERIEPILTRLAGRRGGMFSFRGRNPRS